MISARQRDTRIPRRPFLWLTAALIFTVPPMFGALALWVPVLFLGVLFAKFWMEPRDYRLRSPTWKLLLGAIVLGAVFLTYGSVRGIEARVSIVVSLMALKILEAHTARELQVMVNVGWIVCLCGFFFAQDLTIAICLLIGAILLVVALIEFHRGPTAGSIWMPLRTAGKISLQALPIMVLLFIFFPRINLGLRLQAPETKLAGSGFSGELSPGSVSTLANSSAVAFRAEFPDGQIPRASSLYWRGVVMWQGNGLEWRAPAAPVALPRSRRPMPAGDSVRQLITIEPHGHRWMFALDWPTEPPPGATIAPGNYLLSGQPIRTPRKYSVTSYPEIAEKELRPRERKLYLDVLPNISPTVRQLAQSWTEGAPQPGEVIRRGLEFFHSQGFRYSLAPGEYRNNDLEDFLFNRRTGFCEHYAASFATLMRLAGIPSRVVVGYLGGEYNELGRFFVVRQSDSHAWCEVWLPDDGWKRVDPTSMVAPDRVTLGLSAFLENRTVSANGANSTGLVRGLTRSSMVNNVRLAWQAVNYAWDTRVLSFDEAAQVSLFNSIANIHYDPSSIAIGLVAIICAAVAIVLGWLQLRKRKHRDITKMFYGRFCQKLAARGVPRNPAEGPFDFCARAARLLPDRSDDIRNISHAYIALRYAPETDRSAQAEFTQAVKAFLGSASRPGTALETRQKEVRIE